jgi:hypothetical protein
MKKGMWFISVLLALFSLPMFAQVTPVAANQVQVTDGNGGWDLMPYSAGGSAKVVYASTLSGVTGGQAVAPGSSASGDTDSASALNTVLAAGNTKLILDSGYALSTSLVLYSGDTLECVDRSDGVIMMTASNSTPIINAHQNAPTTASGTGGFLPSNIVDNHIRVSGCTVNANATEAVTGTNSSSVLHGATPGGLFAYSLFFAGVNDVLIDNNDFYDSAAFNILYTNATNVRITNNTVHQPTPLVMFRFTDAIHCIGPCQFVWIQNNSVMSDDDAIALNADDGNRTGSGDVNATYIPAFVQWGPILDFHIDNNTADYAARILRLYSASELIDRVEVTNMNGTSCGGQLGTIQNLVALGVGNVGTVKIDGWKLQSDNTCNNYGADSNIVIGIKFNNIELDHVSFSNPAANYPILALVGGTGGNLVLRDWNVQTSTSTFSELVDFLGGTFGNVTASGFTWNDSIGTGSVFAGAQVPPIMTCSNYAGPNLLLAGGFAPAIQNGDCFTNSYATNYVSTIFNEASSGHVLAGTVPATCSGCSGDWTLASGTDFKYSGSDSISTTTANSGVFDLLNIGRTDGTVRLNVTACAATGSTQCQVALRYTDINNFIAVNINPTPAGNTGMFVYDVVSGTATPIGSVSGSTTVGSYTFTLDGTAITASGPLGTISGTTANTGSKLGLSLTGTSFALSNLSVRSH